MNSPAETPHAGTLRLLLGGDHVGDLMLNAEDRTEFRLSRDYLALYPRPVLGQLFEDDLNAIQRSRMQLPAYFSNLLPEARIRELIAAQIGVSPSREAHLLAYLGEDLPGDIRAVVDGALPQPSSSETLPNEAGLAHPIKFSIAGVQPKLSMFRTPDGLTFPATGRGGNLLVKMPGSRYAGVPENEFLTMSWARGSGIVVPDFWLEPVSELRNVPPELRESTGQVYVVERFDRPAPGKRIHIEDFAQVLDLYPSHEGKYKRTNYETVGAILLQLDVESFYEFLRRLVFVVLSANADAHVKNWSLWYPDRVRARLSPAYDLVSTIEFIEQDELALNLAGSKAWDKVGMASFESLSKRAGADAVRSKLVVRESIERVRSAWSSLESSASDVLKSRLSKHWARVPLAAGR